MKTSINDALDVVFCRELLPEPSMRPPINNDFVKYDIFLIRCFLTHVDHILGRIKPELNFTHRDTILLSFT
ncbi:hypothetical protein [Methanosarcina spelaei]|uniref:hypothetical protein n=1 Tax=Methanosarcina spelaei TaxID=1036679 RepID=UPI001FE39B43|nr:hypothetical protein [Methanosarcina spelaei]